MDNCRRAKEELQKLRQLYTAQMNLECIGMSGQGIKEAEITGNDRNPSMDKQQIEDGVRLLLRKREAEALHLRIERIVNALCILDSEEKQILLFRYAVEGFTPEDIMELLHMEKSTFYRKKRTALEKFARALYGSDSKVR